MEFLELAKNRFSCRSFNNVKIEDEKINKILEAAKVAPTACNFQPQFIYVLKSNEALEKLNNSKKFLFNEALAFIICYDENTCWTRRYDDKKSGEVDATIIATHMMLEAFSLGVYSTWIMSFDPSVLRKDFDIPSNLIPCSILVMGYPSSDAIVNQNHNIRKEIKDFTKEL